MEIILRILFVVVFGVTVCTAQSTNSENIFHDWGKDVCGVQLSIGLTNNIVPLGSTFPAFIEMKNTSTNNIAFGESIPELDFIISLVGDTGKAYQLTPLVSPRVIEDGMHPGASRIWTVKISINKYYLLYGLIQTNTDVPPGNYTIEATHGFSIGPKVFHLASNNLKMQIK